MIHKSPFLLGRCWRGKTSPRLATSSLLRTRSLSTNSVRSSRLCRFLVLFWKLRRRKGLFQAQEKETKQNDHSTYRRSQASLSFWLATTTNPWSRSWSQGSSLLWERLIRWDEMWFCWFEGTEGWNILIIVLTDGSYTKSISRKQASDSYPLTNFCSFFVKCSWTD